MEVICVDSSQNKSVPDDVKCCAGLLKEGEIYTVIQEHRCGYNLLECPHPYNPRGWWAKSRFIPISNIDENEIERSLTNTDR